MPDGVSTKMRPVPEGNIRVSNIFCKTKFNVVTFSEQVSARPSIGRELLLGAFAQSLCWV